MDIFAFITLLVVGIIICVLGRKNYMGNISSLHEYHRNRVSEENIKPFGKMVGTGTMIVGASVLAYALALLVSFITKIEQFTIIGMAIMIIGMVVGIVISFRAMIKYNGGIF